MQDWELLEWEKVAKPVQIAFCSLVLLTGARKCDILRIRRSDVRDQHLLVRNSKTGEDILFILTPTLKKVIDFAISTQKRPGDYLLSNRKGKCFISSNDQCCSFDRSWNLSMRKAIETTELKQPFTRHDLRAKVGSDAESEERAQALLGHTSPVMTRKHYRRKVREIEPTQ